MTGNSSPISRTLLRCGGVALILGGLWLYLAGRNSSASYEFCSGRELLETCDVPFLARFSNILEILLNPWIFFIIIMVGSAVTFYGPVSRILERFWQHPSRYKNAVTAIVGMVLGSGLLFVVLLVAVMFNSAAHLPESVHVYGSLSVPASVAQNTTSPVEVKLDVRESAIPNADSLEGLGSKHPHFLVPTKFSRIEVELLGAGMEVDRERKQVHEIVDSTLAYNWNCYFRELGEFTLTLRMRATNLSGEAIVLTERSFPVSVRNVFGLPVSNANLLTGLASVIGTMILFRPEGGKILDWVKTRRRKRGKIGFTQE
jgi:hypothetical protein